MSVKFTVNFAIKVVYPQEVCIFQFEDKKKVILTLLIKKSSQKNLQYFVLFPSLPPQSSFV